jgi:hypothetical protein
VLCVLWLLCGAAKRDRQAAEERAISSEAALGQVQQRAAEEMAQVIMSAMLSVPYACTCHSHVLCQRQAYPNAPMV